MLNMCTLYTSITFNDKKSRKEYQGFENINIYKIIVATRIFPYKKRYFQLTIKRNHGHQATA